MKKTKLFLHIGHGKTGTSAIQSALAIASEDLAKRGINYPIQQSLRDRASRLEITSGNWEPTSEVSLTNQLLEIAKNNYKNSKIILSSESLFWLVPELIQNKSTWETHIDLHIILAVREIEEMLSSEYQQRVKRHGDAMPLEQFVRARHFVSSHHAKAAEVIELIAQSNITNTIINYSEHKRDISQLIFKLIGAEDLYPTSQMAGAIINRSLSRKELEILITINALYFSRFPWISARISDALIKNQPKLEAQQCKIAKQQLQKVYETNDPYLQTINAFLDSKEQLKSLANLNQEIAQVDSPEQAQKIREEEAISVSLMGDTLLQTLTNESKRKLSNDTVDAIIALSQSGQVSKTTEVELLEVAKENRPQGQKLAQLLERARKELAKP
ncbi:hypothetical protein Q3Y53_08650 [Synechococcus sp. YX-04-1]|uniref:hypothetical protein n=1 Tax=Synechococcus sp. YX-04-1 TaxID=3062778 RepID=UPI0026E37596|nr:hypothetical protein [Synechococcus sp. YX-04-1]MDO6352611.1 hypothetical protein [Synechococcus sp. YX-04-1]